MAVSKAEKEAWEKFVTEEGNKAPWKIPYKVLAERQKRQLLFSSVKFGNAFENDVDQLAVKVLHVLLLDDVKEGH